MKQLSQQIKSFLAYNDLKYISTLHKNERKKTCVLLVDSKDKKQFILKIIEDESPLDIKEKFYNEVEFYKQYSLSFIPNYIQSNDCILQIEFVESITFRDYLLTKKATEKQIGLLFEYAFELYTNINNKKLNHIDFKKAYSHLGALATSGPIQTKNMNVGLFDKIFTRVILKILRYRLEKVLNNIDTKNLRFGFSHGDMHCNNILISTNDEIKLIDFENISRDGFYDFDLIYLYVMTELYIVDDKFVEIKKDIINKICISESNLLKVINLYRIAISLNKRFQVGLNLKSSKLQLLFRSLFK